MAMLSETATAGVARLHALWALDSIGTAAARQSIRQSLS